MGAVVQSRARLGQAGFIRWPRPSPTSLPSIEEAIAIVHGSGGPAPVIVTTMPPPPQAPPGYMIVRLPSGQIQQVRVQSWLDQELIAGVPNKYLLFGSGGALLLLAATKPSRKR